MKTIHILQSKIFALKLIETFTLAQELLKGKKRHTGEPLFAHSYRMFQKSIALGIYDEIILQSIFLHDIIEDTFFTHEDIKNRFSVSVSFVVDALTTMDDEGKKLPKNMYYERFLLSGQKDWRILFVKLLDCIDNLETLVGLDQEKQMRFLDEKQKIFLPIFLQFLPQMPFEVRESYAVLLKEFQNLLLIHQYAK